MRGLTGGDAVFTPVGVNARLACLLALALLGPGLPHAHAHARLVRSNPPDQAVLSVAPRLVELWFNELLDRGLHSLEVIPAAQLKARQRTNYAAGQPVIDPRDRTRVSVPLQPLPAGDYVIEWRVLSRDGHSAPGRLRFTVKPPAH